MVCAKCQLEGLHRYAAGLWYSVCCGTQWMPAAERPGAWLRGNWQPSNKSSRSRGGNHSKLCTLKVRRV